VFSALVASALGGVPEQVLQRGWLSVRAYFLPELYTGDEEGERKVIIYHYTLIIIAV
jgi:hypothetical protein